MLEVEVKARVTSPGQMGRILRMVEDSRRTLTEVQVDTYFSHPWRDFACTDEALRVRRIGQRHVLTYKGPKVDGISKTREEIECEVSPEMGELLSRLGFREVLTVRKRRMTYEMNGFTLSVDDVEGLGTFVEMESESREQTSVEKLLDVLRSLGLESETRSYLELLLEKGR